LRPDSPRRGRAGRTNYPYRSISPYSNVGSSAGELLKCPRSSVIDFSRGVHNPGCAIWANRDPFGIARGRESTTAIVYPVSMVPVVYKAVLVNKPDRLFGSDVSRQSWEQFEVVCCPVINLSCSINHPRRAVRLNANRDC